MQDVFIIHNQIEAIRHNNKPFSMTENEWRSLDEIASSTIRMHLVENVYFSMAKEKKTFALSEKLQVIYEKKFSSSKLLLIRQTFNMKMRETYFATSHINAFTQVAFEHSSQGSNCEEEVKPLPYFRACWRARRYSV